MIGRGSIPAGARVSPHLSWAEATVTQHRGFLREQADPPAQVRANLARAALDLFEPARALVGPLLVSSGYRCSGLNERIGGSRTSAHMVGLAFDVVPLEMEIRDAMERLAGSGIPFDQLIFELGRWLHLGGADHTTRPRGQRLMMLSPGHYEPWNPRDPRVRRPDLFPVEPLKTAPVPPAVPVTRTGDPA